jgi:NAD(P)-dependent dehydrogenase (short-subunit alcohol dehydrogenase family)
LRPEQVFFLETDVLNVASLEDLLQKSTSIEGELTHIVSVAGRALPEEFGDFLSTPIDVLSRSIELNLKSHVYLTRLAVPYLRESSAMNRSISYISSINAIKDFGLPAYSAAKAGLLGLVSSLASECGSMNIRINSVLPGTVRTRLTESEPKDFASLERGTVLRRIATTAEIAEVVWALSHVMTCVTGQNLVADCGQVIRGMDR